MFNLFYNGLIKKFASSFHKVARNQNPSCDLQLLFAKISWEIPQITPNPIWFSKFMIIHHFKNWNTANMASKLKCGQHCSLLETIFPFACQLILYYLS